MGMVFGNGFVSLSMGILVRSSCKDEIPIDLEPRVDTLAIYFNNALNNIRRPKPNPKTELGQPNSLSIWKDRKKSVLFAAISLIY